MHIQTVDSKVYVHAEDKWHLFIHDTLMAVYKYGDPFVCALDRRLSRNTTRIIEQFAGFNNATEVRYVSEEELRNIATPHRYVQPKERET